jgi:hypothetical protein
MPFFSLQDFFFLPPKKKDDKRLITRETSLSLCTIVKSPEKKMGPILFNKICSRFAHSRDDE